MRVLDFIYDESGKPFAVNDSHDGGSTFATYYYVLNYQGDVVKLIDSSSTVMASYTYNAWGEILTATGTMAEINPLRYRGYYYDTETGWYYLQSRYYDPILHRFINADSYASTGTGILGTNMFAYCNNNPVMGFDPTGNWDWGWDEKAALGSTLLVSGLALLFAAPSGGSSLAVGAIALSSTAVVAAGSAIAITGTVMLGKALSKKNVAYSKQSKKSGKERATDKPSWVSQDDVDLGKSSQQNATDLLNNKYGSGNWKTGPKTEFNRIVKWIDRGLKAFLFGIVEIFEEE